MSEFDETKVEANEQADSAPDSSVGGSVDSVDTSASASDAEVEADSDVKGFQKDEPKTEEPEEETWVHFNPRFHEVTKELLEKNGLHGLTRIPLGMKIKL